MTFLGQTTRHAPPPGRSARVDLRQVEWAIVAVTLAVVALTFGTPQEVPALTMTLGALVAWIMVQDLKTFTIADGAVVAIAILAFAERRLAGDGLLAMTIDCLLTGGVLFGFREIYYRYRGFDGIGLGDVKLAGAGGLLVGCATFSWTLLAASLLALGFAASRLLLTRHNGEEPLGGSTRLAFGAFLAPMIWIAWIAQHVATLLPLDQ